MTKEQETTRCEKCGIKIPIDQDDLCNVCYENEELPIKGKEFYLLNENPFTCPCCGSRTQDDGYLSTGAKIGKEKCIPCDKTFDVCFE